MANIKSPPTAPYDIDDSDDVEVLSEKYLIDSEDDVDLFDDLSCEFNSNDVILLENSKDEDSVKVADKQYSF